MFKNVAGQKVVVYVFDSTTNLPKTGDAANLTAYVSVDFGAVATLADATATEIDNSKAKGYYLFDLAQAESNGDALLFSAKSTTANMVCLAMPALVYTTPPNFSNASIKSNGNVNSNLVEVTDNPQAAANLQQFAVQGFDPQTNCITEVGITHYITDGAHGLTLAWAGSPDAVDMTGTYKSVHTSGGFPIYHKTTEPSKFILYDGTSTFAWLATDNATGKQWIQSTSLSAVGGNYAPHAGGASGTLVPAGIPDSVNLAPTGLDAIPITAPAGPATSYREMGVQTWRRFFKKVAYDSVAGTLTTFADDGVTIITVSTATSAGGVQTEGAAT